jgi:glyceraldehyde 3-phosphate dehydrogenase
MKNKKEKIKVAINGFGRIGTVTLRSILLEKYDVEVVAINTKGDFPINAVAHQFKYDSVYKRLPLKIETKEAKKSGEIGRLIIGDKEIPVLGESDPSKIPWKRYGVDVVLECTGAFLNEKAKIHITKGGAKKVVLSAPPKDESIPTFILGVNEETYNGEKLVSNGSCTTNCVAPIIKTIDQKIGFQEGMLSTIHAYTTNQNMVDGASKDPRRGRSGAINIVPTSTGAVKSVTAVYPEVKGRFGGTAIRVPVVCGSYSDLTFKLVRKTTPEEINKILEDASTEAKLIGKMKMCYEPIVSSDVIGNNASCLIDTLMTKVVSDDMVSIGAWYDNEYGYCCRLVELAIYICK